MKKYILLVIATLNTLVSFVIIYNIKAQIVPVHFGIDGTADFYGSKWIYMIMPIIPLILSIFYFVFRSLKKCNQGSKINYKIEDFVMMFILALFLMISWYIIYILICEKIKLPTTFGALILIFLGVFMIIMGYLMPKLERNRYLGLKLPWTLKDENNWKKTHKFSRPLNYIGGIGLISCGFLSIFNSENQIFYYISGLIFVISCVAILPTIYSYLIFRRDKNGKNTEL